MLVIGENINASNKSVGQAISNRDQEFLGNLAQAQSAAGADYIDVNAGTGYGSWEHAEDTMQWLVGVVQAVTDKPLAIDSDVPSLVEAALRIYSGDGLMINSVSAESEKLESIGRLAAERRAMLVALAMGTAGIPNNVEDRLAACELIMSHLARLNIKEEQVLFDPLVLPIAVDTTQALVTLETIQQIKLHYPSAKTVMGLSNISYGLPQRAMVNRAFLLMAAYAGLDAVILNPLDAKMMSFVKIADMLTGKDPSCRGYIRAHRKGILVD